MPPPQKSDRFSLALRVALWRTRCCYGIVFTPPRCLAAARARALAGGMGYEGEDAQNTCRGPEREAHGGDGLLLNPRHPRRDSLEMMESREMVGSPVRR